MSESVRHVLALAPNWVGDAAMCTPALRAMARRFPDAELTVAARPAICDLLRDLPGIRRLVPLPARPSIRAIRHMGKYLHAFSEDLAVVFPHSFRAAFLAWSAGARRRVGQGRNGRSLLLTDAVGPFRRDGRAAPRYMVDEYLEVVAALGCEDDGAGPVLQADPNEVEHVQARIKGNGPFVGIAPGAGFGPSKRWPAERFAAVADALAERAGATCVLLTGPGEEAVRDAVRDAAKRPLACWDRDRPSVDRLKAAVSLLDLLVCNDSGPRQVAVAFRVPTVCVIGPTTPLHTAGPYERGTVIRAEVDCAPCQKPVCKTDHRCMTAIAPEEVVDAATGLLRK